MEKVDNRGKSTGRQLGGALPEGWEEVDDGTGAKYYYNALTYETTWEHPVTHI